MTFWFQTSKESNDILVSDKKGKGSKETHSLDTET